MATLKVYLDRVLLNDNPLGLQDMDFTIEREDTIGNLEQVLREKTETSLKFVGDGYRKIANSRITDYCADILCTIVYSCPDYDESIFEGYIQQRNVEIDIARCIATVSPLKDSSFSALIRDYMEVEIATYYTKSLNCADINPVNQTYTFSDDFTDPTSYVYRRGFDVLDLFKFYVAYITDNRITVVSDYLTATSLGDARYAVTNGYNLHNTNGNLAQTNVLLSFAKLFNELRKKLKLYMAVEYDGQNIPYLRIEPESYFYDNTTKILTIDSVPRGTLETLDSARLYNRIDVGSKDTFVTDEANVDYPQNALTAWNDESFTGCGGCSGDKDNILDLVSEFIIDSNMIYEALNVPAGDAYEHDDKIYLFWYFIDVTTQERIAFIANNPPFNKNIYNETLINETVLENWVGQGTGCVATVRSATDGFYVSPEPPYTVADVNCHPVGCSQIQQRALNGLVIFDNTSNVSTLDVTSINPYTGDSPLPGGVDTASIFTVPDTGNYNFRAYTKFAPCSFNLSRLECYVSLTIVVYTDNTLSGSPIYEFTDTQDFPWCLFCDSVAEVSVETGMIYLSPGNIVFVYYTTDFADVRGELIMCPVDSSFTLIDEDVGCDSISDEANAYPYLVTTEYPICFSDWQTMRDNKGGYIEMNGKEYYIKKVSYKPGKNSTLTLLAKNTICEPCEDVICDNTSCGVVTLTDAVYEACDLELVVDVVNNSDCDNVEKIQVLIERNRNSTGWVEFPLDVNEFVVVDGIQSVFINTLMVEDAGAGSTFEYRVSIRGYCPLTFWASWGSTVPVVFYGSGCTGI